MSLIPLLLSFFITEASAQGPVMCPTRPPSDSSNACANTAWVKANGGGGGGGSGTVYAGTAAQLGWYSSSGTTISGNPNVTYSSGTLTLGVAGTTQGGLTLAGSTSGTTSFLAPSSGGGVWTIQSGSDTILGRATTDTLTNKTFDTGATGNVFKIAGQAISSVSGNTSKAATTNGTLTSGHCVSIDASGNLQDAGGACTTGGGGGTVANVASGAPVLAYYASNGTTVSGMTTGTGNITMLGTAVNTTGGAITYGTALPAAMEPAHTGDMTNTAGSLTTAVNSIGGKSVTLGGTVSTGGNLTFSGAYNFIGTLTGATSVTFPTSGTLLTTTSLATALPSATTSQLYGGSGAAGTAAVVSVGTGLGITAGTLGFASGTSGGLLYYSSGTTVASSSAFTQYAPLYGGGTGAAPAASPVGTLYQVYMSSGGSTYPAFTNLTYILDNVFGSAQGTILYRGSSGWTALSPGTAGYFLQTQGASANPVWAAAGSGSGLTTQTAGYTVLSTDIGGTVEMNCSANCVVTLPAGLSNGGRIDVVQLNTATYSVQLAASGTTLHTASGWTYLAGQYAAVTCYYKTSGTVWTCYGGLSPS